MSQISTNNSNFKVTSLKRENRWKVCFSFWTWWSNLEQSSCQTSVRIFRHFERLGFFFIWPRVSRTTVQMAMNKCNRTQHVRTTSFRRRLSEFPHFVAISIRDDRRSVSFLFPATLLRNAFAMRTVRELSTLAFQHTAIHSTRNCFFLFLTPL